MKDIYQFDHCEKCGIFRTYHINRKCPIMRDMKIIWTADTFQGREIPEQEWESHEHTVS